MKNSVIIIQDARTGERIKLDNIQELTNEDIQELIKIYTKRKIENQIGYYVQYMYEQ